MEIVLRLIPTFLLIGLGYVLKRTKAFDADLGRTLLKFIFLVAAPALTLRSITQLHLDSSLITFLLLPVALTVLSYILVKPLEKKMHLNPKQFAVFLMATMIVNSGFTLPFVVSLAGDEGAARVALFNVTNNLMVFGWVYSIAIGYGEKGKLSKSEVLKKVFLSPAIVALLIALLLNISHTSIPTTLTPTVSFLADLTNPLILIALGLILELKLMHPVQTLQSLLFRMVGGLTVGLLFVKLFSLTGVNMLTALILSASPVGFNAVTFSSLEKLDDEFAASIVSMGLITGLIFISMLTIILGMAVL
jgi:hypothetical protein